MGDTRSPRELPDLGPGYVQPSSGRTEFVTCEALYSLEGGAMDAESGRAPGAGSSKTACACVSAVRTGCTTRDLTRATAG
jgi:hypothetical protein